MSEENQQFTIQKLYLKDASFEAPNTPQVFPEGEWTPHINVHLNSGHKTVGENLFEVVLEVTITAKVEENTAFLVEVKQAGLFEIVGFPEDNLGGMLGAYCPETLFPYVREVVSDLVTKGGFPQLLMSPVNFNSLYTQQMQQQAQTEQGAAH